MKTNRKAAKKSVPRAAKGASSAKKAVRKKTAAGTKSAKAKPAANKKAKPARPAAKTAGKKPAASRAGKKATAKAAKPAGKRVPEAKAEKPTAPAASGATPRLNARQREKFRNLLLAMRNRLSDSISSIKRESLATKDWINVEEDGTDIFDQQFALNIVSSENEMLIQIDEALARLAMNEYGTCEECECGIHEERLKALPFAKTCISCQTKKEGHAKFGPDSGMDGFE